MYSFSKDPLDGRVLLRLGLKIAFAPFSTVQYFGVGIRVHLHAAAGLSASATQTLLLARVLPMDGDNCFLNQLR